MTSDVYILAHGTRTPPHVPVLSPIEWSAKLRAEPQAFGLVYIATSLMTEADLTTLCEAKWTNIVALGELAVTMPLDFTNLDNTTRILRCIHTVITSLSSIVRINVVTIRNPLAIAVLVKKDDIIPGGLGPILYELDSVLSERIAAGTLQRVVFTASCGKTQSLSESENFRVAQLFPILAKLKGDAV